MENFKSGFVTLIGRTNVGKSTLINLLVGEKVAAIANKVQTTRTAIRGIVNRPNSQIIFIDTPGIHKPKTKLNETMIDTSFTSLKDAEMSSDEISVKLDIPIYDVNAQLILMELEGYVSKNENGEYKINNV